MGLEMLIIPTPSRILFACAPEARAIGMVWRGLILGFVVLGVVPQQASAADGSVSIATLVPYAEKAEVRDSIRQDCGLSAKLSKRVVDRGRKKEIEMVRSDDPKRGGLALDLRITDAIETSGGLLPTLSISIDGALKKDGRIVGTFVGTRFARASFFPFRRGECAILTEAVRLIAKDVVKWTAKPSLDARLGDAR